MRKLSFHITFKNCLVILAICVVGCQASTSQSDKTIVETAQNTKTEKLPSPLIDSSNFHQYPWKKKIDIQTNITNRFPTPPNFSRTNENQDSFADWLRHLPLKDKNSQVHFYNKELKPNQSIHAGIIDVDTGNRDLQQCADAVMRLKAEYHFSKKEYNKIHFNYTSGDKVAFEDWSKGKKPIVKGNKVNFSSPTGNIDYSYLNFKKYMQSIFNYAGTSSLSKEMKSVKVKDMQIGDVFIQGGFPGHAVIVVDMAENKNGEKLFMIAQSYMPAQDMHILHNLADDNLSPWYPLNFEDNLYTPEWDFTKQDLKRFR